MLTTEAFIALLKTLEEPVTQSLFILLTANIGFVPETVISRCQQLSLNAVPVDKICGCLISNYNTGQDRANMLGRLSHGCPGWAISAAQNVGIYENYCEKRDKALKMMQSSLDERFSYAAALATQFGKERADVFEVLDIWLDLWRDVLLSKTGLHEEVINIDIKNSLMQLAAEENLSAIRSSIKSVLDAKEQLKQNANPRLVLEVMMMDIPVGAGDIARR
jgi:DNA polymerase-3 subunit delta'